MRITSKYILLIIAIIYSIMESHQLCAQNKNKIEITNKDKEKIGVAINSIIAEYTRALKSITNSDEDQSEKISFIAGIYEGIVKSKGSKIYDELFRNYPEDVENYLNYLMDSVKTSEKEVVFYEAKNDFDLYQNKENLVAVGTYFMHWDVDKPRYGSKKKSVKIYFYCKKDEFKTWTVKIQDIYNETNTTETNWQKIITKDNAQIQTNDVAIPSLTYCKLQIKQATYLLKTKDYAQCYYCTKEAKKNKQLDNSLIIELNDISNKLISKLGENGDWKQNIFTLLKNKAQQLENNKEYRKAYDYLYLGEEANGKVEGATNAMKRCAEKAKMQSLGDGFYANNNYNDAITSYQKLLNVDEENAIANAKIGKCYGDMDSTKEALRFFKNALDIDKKNATVYAIQADYYASNKKYDKALENYNNSLIYCDEYSAELYKTKATIAYISACKNITVKQTAIDSCLASLQYYAEENAEPAILLCDLLKSNFVESLKYADSAINNCKGNKQLLSKALAQKAKLYKNEYRNERDVKKATQHFNNIKTNFANSLDVNRQNNETALEYGDFLLNDAIDDIKLNNGKEFIKLDSAKYYYDIGTNGNNKEFALKCIWKKAKANMLQGNYSEASKYLTENLVKQLLVKDKANIDLAKLKLYNNGINDAMAILQNVKSCIESEYIIILCKLKRNQSITSYTEETLKDILQDIPMKIIDSDFEYLHIDYNNFDNLKSVMRTLKR